jgi:acyl-CoA reductase-like NAD-dependent aldehyde dehydrogenase
MAERAAVSNAVADLLIGGEHRPAAGGERVAVTNPHDGSVIAEVGRERGPAAMAAYTEQKTVYLADT